MDTVDGGQYSGPVNDICGFLFLPLPKGPLSALILLLGGQALDSVNPLHSASHRQTSAGQPRRSPLRAGATNWLMTAPTLGDIRKCGDGIYLSPSLKISKWERDAKSCILGRIFQKELSSPKCLDSALTGT